jgi:hypothetical protein
MDSMQPDQLHEKMLDHAKVLNKQLLASWNNAYPNSQLLFCNFFFRQHDESYRVCPQPDRLNPDSLPGQRSVQLWQNYSEDLNRLKLHGLQEMRVSLRNTSFTIPSDDFLLIFQQPLQHFSLKDRYHIDVSRYLPKEQYGTIQGESKLCDVLVELKKAEATWTQLDDDSPPQYKELTPSIRQLFGISDSNESNELLLQKIPDFIRYCRWTHWAYGDQLGIMGYVPGTATQRTGLRMGCAWGVRPAAQLNDNIVHAIVNVIEYVFYCILQLYVTRFVPGVERPELDLLKLWAAAHAFGNLGHPDKQVAHGLLMCESPVSLVRLGRALLKTTCEPNALIKGLCEHKQNKIAMASVLCVFEYCGVTCKLPNNFPECIFLPTKPGVNFLYRLIDFLKRGLELPAPQVSFLIDNNNITIQIYIDFIADFKAAFYTRTENEGGYGVLSFRRLLAGRCPVSDEWRGLYLNPTTALNIEYNTAIDGLIKYRETNCLDKEQDRPRNWTPIVEHQFFADHIRLVWSGFATPAAGGYQ